MLLSTKQTADVVSALNVGQRVVEEHIFGIRADLFRAFDNRDWGTVAEISNEICELATAIVTSAHYKGMMQEHLAN